MKRFRRAVARPVLRIPCEGSPTFNLYFFIPEGMDAKEARTRAFDAVTRYRSTDGPPDDITTRLSAQGFVPVEFVDAPLGW